MFAVLGASLFAGSVVLFYWAFIEHNRPSPKSWTRPEFVAHTISLFLTMTVATGVSFIITAFFRFEDEPLSFASGLAVLAIIGAGVVALGLLRAWWLRLKAEGVPPLTVHEFSAPANDPGTRTPPRHPARPRRRKAA